MTKSINRSRATSYAEDRRELCCVGLCLLASRLRPPWSPKAKCQALVASAGLVIQLCWNVAPLSHPRWVESRSRGKLGVPQPVPQRDPFPPEAVFPRSLRVGGIQAPPSEEDDVSKQKRLRPQRRQPMQAEWARLMRLSKDLGCSSQPPQGPSLWSGCRG